MINFVVTVGVTVIEVNDFTQIGGPKACDYTWIQGWKLVE